MASQNCGNDEQEKEHLTAGIIVIGDEILSGSTKDSNSHFMCKRLHERGVFVKKITVIGDDVDDIASEVRLFSGRYDYVFTTGGVGPTHDDRTFAGLASAFNEELSPSSELKDVVQIFLAKTKLHNIDEAINKFINIPKSAKLIWGQQYIPTLDDPNKLTNFPSVQIRNVIALPGVPRFCEQSFLLLEEQLFPHNPFFSRSINLRRNEVYLQKRLTEIAQSYSNKNVTIGSYPILGHNYYKTKLLIESTSNKTGQEAYDELVGEFSEYVINFDDKPWENSKAKFDEFLQTQPADFSRKVVESLKLVDDILDKYNFDQIALSFNGGKDSTILLHMLRVAVDIRFGPFKLINGFYILGEDEFDEMRIFVRSISQKYGLSLHQLTGSLKAGLAQLKVERPEILVVVMGSRSTDPHGKFMKSNVQSTDPDWPHFLRVCPVFDWSYSDVWKVIRGLSIPYCSLYDEGYTSLGTKAMSRKNPALKIEGKDKYYPAWMLEQENLERHFRDDSG